MNVYLHLFHGRNTPNEDMENWGIDGPVLGPLSFVHTTYGSILHLGDKEGGTICDLDIVKGLVFYEGVYYGDWSVFDEGIYQRARTHQQMDEAVMPTGASIDPPVETHAKPHCELCAIGADILRKHKRKEGKK